MVSIIVNALHATAFYERNYNVKSYIKALIDITLFSPGIYVTCGTYGLGATFFINELVIPMYLSHRYS